MSKCSLYVDCNSIFKSVGKIDYVKLMEQLNEFEISTKICYAISNKSDHKFLVFMQKLGFHTKFRDCDPIIELCIDAMTLPCETALFVSDDIRLIPLFLHLKTKNVEVICVGLDNSIENNVDYFYKIEKDVIL